MRAEAGRATSTVRASLALLGDIDHHRPHLARPGRSRKTAPAGEYLMEHQVQPRDFNTYGSRRGNHEVMMRGTFANIRLRNELVPGVEGGITMHHAVGRADADLRRGDAIQDAKACRWS